MAKVKWCAAEFTPNQNQIGMSHSWSARAAVDNTITTEDIAAEVEARGLSRAAEIEAVLKEAANVILKEVQENNRVQLEAKGGILVSFFPKVRGSISDATVRANPDKYNGAQVATEDMLTADMLTWSIGVQVGTNFSRQFAQQKQAQKVSGKNVTVIDDEGNDSNTGSGTNGGSQSEGSGNGSGDNGGDNTGNMEG